MQRLPDRLPSRVIIEGVTPEIDGGRFPIKRTVGEDVLVGADIHADGHDVLSAVLRYRHASEPEWKEVDLEARGNDRWEARFPVTALGRYEYTLQAWVDRFASWRRDLSRKAEAGQDVSSDLLEGAELVNQAARRARAEDGDWLRWWADTLGKGDNDTRVKAALDPVLGTVMARQADRGTGSTYDRVLSVTVDRERARYGAWYELFPRSCAGEPGRHGTFKDVEKRLPYVRDMGFDVLYLPPIHPIGKSFRKGPNNTLNAGPDDSGSPWGIGGAEGGHTAIHPQLGTQDDFDHLLAAARRTAWRLPWTLPSSAPPITPGSTSTPNGFATDPTAPSSTPRTRPRNTRTSTHSTSSAATGRACGTNCSA